MKNFLGNLLNTENIVPLCLNIVKCNAIINYKDKNQIRRILVLKVLKNIQFALLYGCIQQQQQQKKNKESSYGSNENCYKLPSVCNHHHHHHQELFKQITFHILFN